MKVGLPAWGGRSLRLLAIGMENTKEQSMKLHDWELTIQQIIEESNHEPKESGKSRLLMEWRAKLAREPHLLQPYQIDEIVREIRKRLTSSSLQPGSGPPRSAFVTSTRSSPYSITR
jgi:hypothetical protein